MRFHLVSLPHTQTTKSYSACAYTEKVRKFANMMTARGHEVILYASEHNEAKVAELVTCITESTQEKYGFFGPEDYLKIVFDVKRPIWQAFNKEVIKQLKGRLKPKDFICVIDGEGAKPIADAYPGHMTVEFGIGYTGVFSKYRVFESYAWRNYIYGMLDGETRSDTDGNFYDAAIPNYFEIEDFPLGTTKDDYYLFIGRLADRKGWRIAQDVCQQLGKRLIVAGQGNFSGYGEYEGMVGPKRRGELMSKAQAVFVPTLYIPPFEGVHIEAMLCGTPVITTDFGVFSETVTNGVNGFRCNSFQEFVDAAENVRKFKNYSSIAIDAQLRYSLDAVGPQYERYFEHLMTLWGEGWNTGKLLTDEPVGA